MHQNRLRSFALRTALLSAAMALLAIPGCGIHRYTNPDLLKKTEVTFPKEYQNIISPLDSALVPIRKRIFLLRNDVAKMKDKLWDGGSNQRITRIDDNIDTARKEISTLSAIQKEILNTIYHIYPGYEEPEILPYVGEGKKYKEIKKPIILVTLQDQRDYEDVKSGGGRLVRKPGVQAAGAVCAQAVRQPARFAQAETRAHRLARACAQAGALRAAKAEVDAGPGLIRVSVNVHFQGESTSGSIFEG